MPGAARDRRARGPSSTEAGTDIVREIRIRTWTNVTCATRPPHEPHPREQWIAMRPESRRQRDALVEHGGHCAALRHPARSAGWEGANGQHQFHWIGRQHRNRWTTPGRTLAPRGKTEEDCLQTVRCVSTEPAGTNNPITTHTPARPQAQHHQTDHTPQALRATGIWRHRVAPCLLR